MRFPECLSGGRVCGVNYCSTATDPGFERSLSRLLRLPLGSQLAYMPYMPCMPKNLKNEIVCLGSLDICGM